MPPEEAPESTPGRWAGMPTAIVAAAVIVALVAVSGLLVVLFRRTTGPGEVLRDFARRLEAQDCPGTYDLLAPAIRDEVDEAAWCDALPGLHEHLAPTFTIGQRTFHEGVATIEVRGEGTTEAVWLLRKAGRTWEVLGVEGAVPFPGSAV